MIGTKRAARGKLVLRKYLIAQTGLQLLNALLLMGAAVSTDRPLDNLQVAGSVFGVSAVVIGTLGLKRGASRLLKVYTFLMGLAVGFALVPLTTGAFYEKMLNFTELKSSKDYRNLATLGLEGVKYVLGTLVNLMGISVAANLIGNMSPPKKRER